MSTIVTLLGKVECQKKKNDDNNDTSKDVVWTWKGAWAFGESDPPPSEPSPAPHSAPASLPFAYKFERVVDAKRTPIPSLQPLDTDVGFADAAAANDNNPSPEGGGGREEERPHDSTEPQPSSSAKTHDDSAESKPKTGNSNEETKEAIPKPVDESELAPSEFVGGEEKSTSLDHTVKSETSAASVATTQQQHETKGKGMEEQDKSNPPDTNTAPVKQGDQCSTAPSRSDASNSQETKHAGIEPKEPPKGPTFGDDGFVDACTKHSACPPSGRWKGSFQAAIGRKGQQRSDIPEYFDVFLYVEPPTDAQVQFSNPREPLPPQHVYIRGAGENQFGVFELVGTFALETQMLKLQRLYVRIPPEPPRRGRGRKSRHGHEDRGVGRPSRKRQLSWKRKEALVDETSRTAGGSQASTLSGDESRPSKKQKRKRDENAPSASDGMTTPKAGGGIPHTVSTTVDNNNKRTPPKTSQASRLSSTTPHGSTVVRLPVEAYARNARWRAAHFYHYNPAPKDTAASSTAPATSPNNANNNNSTGSNATTAKSVVYEGELYDGLRYGRGVCVYSNDMVYEGEWQRDKEHGFGSLWTGDRKRIIYEGEWERGRMHGHGKYYYYQHEGKSSDSSTADVAAKIQSRYEGEYRENLRHGNGMYVLPDGSTYNGQWQNGNMNGRGTFTWPDGSVYDGDWKENKRHGSGVLKASDGFYYEGSWVHNTMEGRGSATYPDGQEYHGMFSSGRREGRGTVKFPNGAIYEGRFRDDAVDGQGTMKIRKAVLIPLGEEDDDEDEDDEQANGGDETQQEGTKSSEEATKAEQAPKKADFMIPISFQSDMGHIHRRAGFTLGGI